MDLQITALSKRYPNGVLAMDNINLTIGKGMLGLLGPNGAGKSTLMRTIATLQDPDEGSISLGNIDVLHNKKEVRKLLGYLPQDFGFYPKVTALSLLDHFAVLKGIANKNERKEIVEALLQQTNLFEARKRNVSEYSGGMRQRFGVAQALLGNPKLVIVDEPTAGLDPQERNRFYNILSEIGNEVIVILSTHIVEDVKTLCNRAVIMNRGKVLADASPAQLVQSLEGKVWRKLIERDELPEYKKQFSVISQSVNEGKLHIRVLSNEQPAEDFINVTPGLEDVYFSTI